MKLRTLYNIDSIEIYNGNFNEITILKKNKILF